jgi:hypothetical protein
VAMSSVSQKSKFFGIIPRINGRKGFTYLIVTTVIVVVLLSIFFVSSRYTYQDQEQLQQVRIRAMNDFIKNLNTDIHRATYISAFRALLALEENVATTGVYLTDINNSFEETFVYGTVNGTSYVIMSNSTFSDYLAKVQYLAQSTGIILNINVTQVKLKQSNPWFIDVYMDMNITAIDTKNTSSWHIYKEYVTSIPINDLRDPLYSKNTLNKVPNTIRRLNSTILVNGTNTTTLVAHISDSYYLASPFAPNLIMRFEGKTGPDANGIESIVNITKLAIQGLPRYDNRVKVDYIYFNDIATDTVCNIQNIPASTYFIIPSNRRLLYQVENLTNSTCS